MLTELREENEKLVVELHEAHGICQENGDVATTSLIEVWIDERNVWFLFEATRIENSRH